MCTLGGPWKVILENVLNPYSPHYVSTVFSGGRLWADMGSITDNLLLLLLLILHIFCITITITNTVT